MSDLRGNLTFVWVDISHKDIDCKFSKLSPSKGIISKERLDYTQASFISCPKHLFVLLQSIKYYQAFVFGDDYLEQNFLNRYISSAFYKNKFEIQQLRVSEILSSMVMLHIHVSYNMTAVTSSAACHIYQALQKNWILNNAPYGVPFELPPLKLISEENSSLAKYTSIFVIRLITKRKDERCI